MMGQAFCVVFARELRLAWRSRSRLLQPLVFYALAMLLLVIGLGPAPAMLEAAAPGLLWVLALFAVLLSAGALFRSEHEEGSLDVWRTCGVPLAWLLFAKLLAHALVVSVPLALAGPLLGAWLGIPAAGLGVLFVSLLLGVPVLCWIGALGAALTLGLPAGGILLALIVLPLYVPVLMFGSLAVHAAIDGRPVLGPLSLIAAFVLLAASLVPVAVAAALRAGQE